MNVRDDVTRSLELNVELAARVLMPVTGMPEPLPCSPISSPAWVPPEPLEATT